MLRRSDVFLSVALALAVGAPASAAPVTVSFTGSVSSLIDDDGLLDGSVGVGTAYSGTFTYDPTLLSDSEPDPNHGNYEIDASSFSLVLSIGSYTITFDPAATFGSVTMANDDAGVSQDQYTLNLDEIAGFESLPGALAGTFLQLLLRDDSETALASDALTSVPYADGAWNSRRIQFGAELESEAFVDVEGTLSIVPEPASALLLAPLALLVLRRVGRSAPIS